MSDVNYDALLTESVDNIPQEVIFPQGLYTLRCRGARFVAPKEADQKPRLFVNWTVKAPQDDVDAAEWDALKKDDREATEVLSVFNLVNAYDWSRVFDIAAKSGIDKTGMTKKDLFDSFAKTEVIAYVKPRTFQDKQTGETRQTNDVGNFAAVE